MVFICILNCRTLIEGQRKEKYRQKKSSFIIKYNKKLTNEFCNGIFCVHR